MGFILNHKFLFKHARPYVGRNEKHWAVSFLTFAVILLFHIFSSPASHGSEANQCTSRCTFECKQPIPAFTLAENTSLNSTELDELCRCIWGGLSENQKQISQKFTKNQNKAMSDLGSEKSTAFISNLGQKIQGCFNVQTNTMATMDGPQAEKIIQAFGAVQLETAGHLVAHENRLPFSKDKIKQALLFAMPLVDNGTCEILRTGYVQLGMFHDVRELTMLDIPEELAKLSDKQLYSLIESGGAGRFGIQLQEFVIANMKSLLSELPKCS